jgi:RNA polymerase sigma-70 factor (ECF subfamily)
MREGNPPGPAGVSDAVAGASDAEQQLVERSRRGDARAYEDLVRRHQHLAFRTACVFTASAADAEEAVQDSFVKAWGALPRFRAGAPFRPWLLAIVANEAKTRRRASGRRLAWTLRAAEDVSLTGETAAPSAESVVLGGERRAALLEALAALPERERTVLELRYLLELSEADMAVVLRCRPGTVKSRLSRALDRLRADLEIKP